MYIHQFYFSKRDTGRHSNSRRHKELGKSTTRGEGRSRNHRDSHNDLRDKSKDKRDLRSKSKPLELGDRGKRGRRLDDEEHHRSGRRGRSKAPLGKQAKDIGKRLENSRIDYIEDLRAIAGDDKDYILTDTQVYKMFDNARIRLRREEKEDFIRKFCRLYFEFS